MENQQMAMPAEMAAAGPNPDEMAIYEQMRQEISPQEFSNEMLAGASQVDPQAVAEFTQELQGLDMPPEVLDALNDVVDEILANPERYAELRAQYMEQGLPEDILPEQFDPQFFAALNMAIDQMIAAPTGVQAFAQGGIAELKPIAKAIASYGRNGDTMLAHITPAEARMLRRRGGSGTINPDTGLPEFFIKKLFKGVGKALKSVGNAVKKFASSTVGRLVTTVALGFFLGPAAASFMGVGSAAGVAAVSGFVGSAGSTLLAGGNLKDALKAGAVGGLTAGATAGVMGGADAFASGSSSTAGMTPGQAFQTQVDSFKGMLPGSAPAPAPGAGPQGIGPNQMPVPDAGGVTVGGPMIDSPNLSQTGQNLFGSTDAPAAIPGASVDATAAQGSLAKPAPAEPGMFDSTKKFINEKISPSGIREAGQQEAMSKTLAQFPNATAEQVMSAPANSVLGKAYAGYSPGILQTYGPATALGLGTMAAFGGFDTKPVQGGEITNSLMKPVTQRIQEKGTQRQMYMQGLPGVVYDDFGAPVYGQSTRLPTYDVPDYNSGGFGSPGQGIMNLPSVYVPPSGTIGSRSVAQPYNNSDMYSNIMPRGYDDGGEVTPVAPLGDRVANAAANSKLPSGFNWEQYVAANPDLGRAGIDTQEEAQNHWLNNGSKENRALNPEEGAQREAARLAALAEQKAARDAVAQQKAMRRAAGSGSMYANINAGLSALAPETNPMDTADTTFGARNRQAQLANLQQTYGPMLQNQRNAMNQQSAALGQPAPNTPSPYTAAPAIDRYSQMVQDQYARIGRTGFGDQTSQIDVPGFNNFVNELRTGRMNPADLPGRFDTAVQDYMRDRPDDRYTRYVQEFQRGQERPITTMPVTPPPGDFQHFGIDEYGRGAGEGFGTAPPPGMQPIYQPTPGAALGNTAGLSMQQIANTPGMGVGGIGMNFDPSKLQFKGQSLAPELFMNMGGIAGLAQGGYPRRNGQISGPGTEKSDSIPAMLSDGEFVMTAKAVRGAGKGSRRAGAKQMYKLMHQLEKNAERG